MKEKELREASTCTLCQQKIGACGVPIFYRVTVQDYALNHMALQRQTGLEMMMGGAVGLAQALGPNEDLAQPICEPTTVTICADCYTGKRIVVAQLAEEE